MGKKLSIREIAEKTSLSIATVSRALDPRFVHKVKEETRLKILRYCNECDYRPNNAGRSLVTGKTFKVGFISGQIAGDLGDKHFSYYFTESIDSPFYRHSQNVSSLKAVSFITVSPVCVWHREH